MTLITAAAIDFRGRLEDVAAARAYVFGGFGRFTIVSKKTGVRFTYRLTKADDDGSERARPIFVKVLTGPDNEAAYQYLGCVWPSPEGARFVLGTKSKISADAPSARAFDWLVSALRGDGDAARFEALELWHEGRCGRCGRALTVPESIATGLGPVCAGKV